MALPHPQAPQDWLSQAWNIALGRRMDPSRDAWLMGPIGETGGIHEKVIGDIARREGLTIDRANCTLGLMGDFSSFPHVAGRVDPRIAEFYTATPDFEFDVWSRWSRCFEPWGRLVTWLYSRRIGQLNLPGDSMDTSHGITSEVILLRDDDGRVRHRVWLRRLRKSGEVIYSGVYDHTTLPSGEPCLKVVFPLPKGNATVIMRLLARRDGGLVLVSQGRRNGDPGFYFLVEDRRGAMWQHYVSSFHERIIVFIDEQGELRADHEMRLWGWRTYRLHYRIRKIAPPGSRAATS
jgi:hypothetical protein